MNLYEQYGLAQRVAEYSTDPFRAPDWLRYARTVCFDGYSPPVYPNIKHFDAGQLVKIALDLGADTLRFQPIGYWAYYPSQVFRVHPDLGARDLMAEVAAEARRAGLHIYCYCPYAHPHMELGWTEDHPEYADWICRDRDGSPRGVNLHYGSAERHVVHRLGDTYRKAIRAIVSEYCAHDIDGVYFDAPCGQPMYTEPCFCDTCRRNFKDFCGMDIDRLADANDREASLAWYHWTQKVTQEDLLDFRQIIHGSGKFMLCHNGCTWDSRALRQQYRIPEGFMVEFSVQTYQRIVHGLMGASMARPGKKLAQMYLGSYDVKNFNEPSHTGRWVASNTNLEDGDEIRMEGFVSLACGNAPLYCMANRFFYGSGSGSAEPAREVFDFMRRHEPLLKDSAPAPFVTVVPSWDALRLWQSGRRTFNMDMSEGFALAMLDARLSVDVYPNTELTAAWLKEQRVIALCGASGMSDTEAALLADWVRGGGALLATWDTGLYDEDGQLRADGGALRDVLGVDMAGEPLPSRPDCYVRVAAAHPALGAYGPGALVMGDARNVPVRVREGAMLVAEMWDLGFDRSRGPAIVVNQYGKGKAVYLSGSLENYYTVTRVPSLRRLLASMVRWLGDDAPPPFDLSAPRGVYGVLRRAANGDRVLWVLAPVGFKDAVVGRMRQEFAAVANVGVRVLVPEGRRVRAVRLLRAGRSLPFDVEGGYVAAALPSVHIAEAVHIELE